MPTESFYCEKCDYTAKRKSDYQKHLKTKKHNVAKKDNSLTCTCGKEYKYASSLYKHKKKCTKHLESHTDSNVNMKITETNQESGNTVTTNKNGAYYTSPGFPENFDEMFKKATTEIVNSVRNGQLENTVSNEEESENNDVDNDDPSLQNSREMLLEGSVQYQNMQSDLHEFINNIGNTEEDKQFASDFEQKFSKHEEDGMNMFDMVCTIEDLEIPYSVYEYSMEDPEIKRVFNKITAILKSCFTIENNTIIIDRESMTRDDIDKHNLTVVNNLLFIAQEQQRVLKRTIVEPEMYLEPDDVKLEYYKEVVKMIVFLYGDEIQEITEMLIDSLQMHRRTEPVFD
jgi:hypothetical protein